MTLHSKWNVSYNLCSKTISLYLEYSFDKSNVSEDSDSPQNINKSIPIPLTGNPIPGLSPAAVDNKIIIIIIVSTGSID